MTRAPISSHCGVCEGWNTTVLPLPRWSLQEQIINAGSFCFACNSQLVHFLNPQIPKPGSSGAAPPVRDNGGTCRSSSISSGTGGRILSLSSMSESVQSGLSCFLSDQALEQEERQKRSSQLAEFQRLREVRAAAQQKNLEDFLRMNHVSLRDTTSYTSGMLYR